MFISFTKSIRKKVCFLYKKNQYFGSFNFVNSPKTKDQFLIEKSQLKLKTFVLFFQKIKFIHSFYLLFYFILIIFRINALFFFKFFQKKNFCFSIALCLNSINL